MKDININNNQSIDLDTHFEGEETLSREYKEQLCDQKEDSTLEVYPDAIVNIFPESQSAFQLLRKYQKNPPLIKLDPDFQRSSVWTPKQMSELIESILMGIPLPLIYVKEDEFGTYIIVDGRQRLTTLFDFMTYKFKLSGLNVLTDLNGCYFSDAEGEYLKHLSQLQQSKIEDCQLNLNVIKPPTSDRVTFDLFDRVNRGGTRLNNQEMRNAIYQGKATKFLNKLAALESFKESTEYAVTPKRMKDKYLILRLVAFYLWRTKQLIDVKASEKSLVEYKSDLEEFLSKALLYLNDPVSQSFRTDFPYIFNNAMESCSEYWREGCFRLPPHPDSNTRRPINMALFESAGYLMLLLLESESIKEKDYNDIYINLLDGVYDYSGKVFYLSLTYIVDSNISVTNRFEIVETAIRKALK